MKRPYITGPVVSAPDLTRDEKYARFTRAELVLRTRGYSNPINKLAVQACLSQDCNGSSFHPDGSYRHSRECYLKHDLIAMLTEADGLALLPRWKESRGAMLKRHVADALGWEIIDLTKDDVVLGLPHELERVRSGKRAKR